jgi:hypothetical protein
MVLFFILYGTMAGMLFGLAARLAAPLLSPRGRSRLAWIMAAGATSLIVLAPTLGIPPRLIPSQVVAATLVPEIQLPVRFRSTLLAVQDPAYWAWSTAGVTILAVVAAWGVVLAALCRWRWKAATVDGVPVRVAPQAGPAVVGFAQTLVLPEWLLHRPRGDRRLILSHELEHRAAGDGWLVLLAWMALAVQPWNIALWWQVRELRRSIEFDCDLRVLARHPGSRRRYARLLVRAATHTNGGLPFAAGSGPLAQRVLAIARPRAPRVRALRLVPIVLLATAAVLLPDAGRMMCDLVDPNPTRPEIHPERSR